MIEGERKMRRQMSGRVAAAALVLATAASAVYAPQAHALSDGLALTPPMGWNSWNKFGCDISEGKIRAMADALVRTGLRDLGYTYVNIDDCWQAPTRDARGNLRGDPVRFPSGMKALADYIHSRGLKAGIYATPGRRTCANIWNKYPGQLGSMGHEEQDARTFARWGYDFVKYDWCMANKDGLTQQESFTRFGKALKATRRPIIYSIHSEPNLPVLAWRPQVAHMWRTTPDIKDNWTSMIGTGMINAFGQRYTGPGSWNDADMLEVGNGGMTDAEYRTHMSMWSIMASPLLLGNDLRSMTPSTREIIANKYAIAVNQDKLAAPSKVVSYNGQTLIMARRLTYGRLAVTITNVGRGPVQISSWFNALHGYGLAESRNYIVTDVWGNYHRAAKRYVEGKLLKHETAFFIITPVTARQRAAFESSEEARISDEKAEAARQRQEAAERYAREHPDRILDRAGGKDKKDKKGKQSSNEKKEKGNKGSLH